MVGILRHGLQQRILQIYCVEWPTTQQNYVSSLCQSKLTIIFFFKRQHPRLTSGLMTLCVCLCHCRCHLNAIIFNRVELKKRQSPFFLKNFFTKSVLVWSVRNDGWMRPIVLWPAHTPTLQQTEGLSLTFSLQTSCRNSCSPYRTNSRHDVVGITMCACVSNSDLITGIWAWLFPMFIYSKQRARTGGRQFLLIGHSDTHLSGGEVRGNKFKSL